MKRLLGIFLTIGSLAFISSGCYTLKSTAIPIEMKYINIGFFENNAQLVVGNLSQTFTEALKERVRSTTRLSIVAGEGNANMSGAITGYHFEPISVQATNNNVAPIAGAQRLSITVHVKFVYDAEKKYSFEQDFTRYADYTGDIATQEQTLILTIEKQLIDDIFNKAFNNW
ncbi:LPS assembly lipoprotein LptE [Mucilaginibacter sp.]|uniref:LPS assembly lipoprotein LptE n=1 Tax=Mucilaginibacter sp. TaxID=1882438 RepID=UPI0026337174|nr:LPS assembly lipoprotein LptE [Mucilaginibacter sp.]MDB4925725.1 hypothetical protein [Mucilaginibacter sp.]